MEVGHSPTCRTSTVYLLTALDSDMVSGFPPLTCCPYHLTMVESVRYIWCLRKAPIMKENLPLSSKGVAMFRNVCGPNLAMKFVWNNTPLRSYGLHIHGKKC